MVYAVHNADAVNMLANDCHRYFCGVSSSPKQQRALLEQFFNDCFKKNKSHAREGKHAVTFTDCRKVANQVLASNEVECQ